MQISDRGKKVGFGHGPEKLPYPKIRRIIIDIMFICLYIYIYVGARNYVPAQTPSPHFDETRPSGFGFKDCKRLVGPVWVLM